MADPNITLRDQQNDKTAALSAGAEVRLLLATVIERVGKDDRWRNKLPPDATESVAAEILRKTGDIRKALSVVRDASIAAIFADTSLAEDAKAVKNSAKIPEAPKQQRLLADDEQLERLKDDVGDAIEFIWPTYRRAIEEHRGEEKQKGSITFDFFPETDEANAYIRVTAKTTYESQEVTRTAKVRVDKDGRSQLELWSS